GREGEGGGGGGGKGGGGGGGGRDRGARGRKGGGALRPLRREEPVPFLLRADARKDAARQPPLRVQVLQGAAGRGDHPRLRHGSLRHPLQRQQGGRPDPGVARGDRRFRRAGFRRNGLGRARAQQAFDAVDGPVVH